MSINFKDALGVHPDALKLRAERTRILASNIANENTPGYEAQDMDFNATLQQVMDSDGSGFSNGLGLDTDGVSGDPLYRVPYHPTRDGNTVEIGVEQAAFSQNASDFQTSLTFVNMQLKGLAKAIAGQ
ncbi:flagellar basal body rod protein FlgB [Undibacterium sp. TJN25]|uniref:flagellar basal body rod protein FlgB n=1 Tax=Undibacterium sp. TJN25 TaxID=3413056 RepID=UPI003BF0A6F4